MVICLKGVIVGDLIASVLGTVILLVIIALAISLLLAFPVMWTWNAVIPYLFGLQTLTWGKAWCLLFLSGCLIKSTSYNTKK